MSRTVSILGGLAAVQLALAALTWWPDRAVQLEARDLVALPGAIDRIQISGRLQPGQTEPSGKVELKKEGDHWVLPGLYDFPVEDAKITDLLDKLSALEVRAPVATRPTSHSSLNVTDGDHARRVVLHSGDAQVDLILGSASGQAVHVRRAGEDPVYVVRGWNAWAIGDTDNRYWDSRLVDGLDADSFDSLTLTRGPVGFTLEKGSDGWTAAGRDLVLDDVMVDALLQRIASLRASSVVGTQRTADLDAGTRLEWTAMVDGNSQSGALSIGSSDGADTVVQVDGSPWVVKVPASSVKKWTELELQTLVFEDDLEDLE